MGGPQASSEPELSLLLALLRSPLDREEVAGRVRAVVDWAHFLLLVERHRVASLVASRLAGPGVPAGVRGRLAAARQRHARQGLRQIAEAARLTGRLEGAGIACLVLKGPGLSVRGYGEPLLRDSRDVDLLVEPAALGRAQAILLGAGLRLMKPLTASRPLRALFLRYSHECLLTAPSGVTVELKTRLQPTRSLLPVPAAEVLARRAWQPVAGTPLPVLADQDLLPYLCGHGARHCWFRLKWLADIAALLAANPAVTAARLMEDGERLGVEVAVLEALGLSHDWLGSAVPAPLLSRGLGHPLVCKRRPLVERAVRALGPSADASALPGLEAILGRSELLLRPEARYRLAVLERHAVTRLQAATRRMLRCG